MENLILIDWLSATKQRPDSVLNVTYDSYDSGQIMKEILGLENQSWIVLDGVKGFSKRVYFEGINIHTPSIKMPYIWLEMSGSGCRTFETYSTKSWSSLLRSLIKFGYSIKRIDLAHDDHTGILDMPTLINDTLNESYVSKSTKHEVIIGMDDNTHERDCSIYHGSKTSNTLIRIYDKARQLDLQKEHWIRTEIQLRDENAQNTAEILANDDPVGDLFCGILLRYLRYIEVSDSDSNRWRWSMKDYWSDLVKDAQPIQIASRMGIEYNVSNLESFVFGQAGGAIKTYIDAFGIDKFISKVGEYHPYITNPKYRRLLEEIRDGKILRMA